MSEKFLSSFSPPSMSNTPLSVLRKRSWDRFLEMGLPTKKEEAFRYLPLLSLYENAFEAPSPQDLSLEEVLAYVTRESRHSYFVFIDGILRLDLSDLSALPLSVIVRPLEESFQTFGNFLHSRWNLRFAEGKDPFAQLNGALLQGAFIYVPPKTVLATPLQCLHLFSKGTTTSMHARLHLFVGAQSEISFCSKTVAKSAFYTSYCDVALEEGAKCTHSAFFSGAKEGWHFDYVRATLKQNSLFKGVSWNTGSKSTRQDLHLILSGENSEADLHGGWRLEKNHQAHIRVRIDHLAPHCRSLQRFKGVLNGASRSSFAGKIYIAKEAQKTEAYQLNNNLLLSSQAIAYSTPNLEIFADDVKASHGSTVAKIDSEPLFYLQTRGIDEESAKQMLVAGFCQEIIDQIPIGSLREEIGRS